MTDRCSTATRPDDVQRRSILFSPRLAALSTAVFLVGLLVTGLCIYTDYGISWDEQPQRDMGFKTLNYILRGDDALLTGGHRYYGPAFQTALATVEKIVRPGDIRDVFLLRHLCTFLFFYAGVVAFAFTCGLYFKNWWYATLGGLILVLHPRIFAHSFYNPKDIPFLSAVCLCLFTVYLFLRFRSLPSLLLHALTSGLLIAVRVVGGVFALITCGAVLANLLAAPVRERDGTAKAVKDILCYGFLSFFFTVLFWPAAWDNPLWTIVKSVLTMSDYHPMRGYVLLEGSRVSGDSIPAHYAPLWFVITTPIMLLLLPGIGALSCIGGALRSAKERFSRMDPFPLLVFTWLAFNVGLIVLKKPVLYNGWRQCFYLYPAIAFLAVSGLKAVLEYGGGLWRTGRIGRRAAAVTLFAVLIGAAADTVRTMVALHPYQYGYFTRSFRWVCPKPAREFEFDYWGVSVGDCITALLEQKPGATLCIDVQPDPYTPVPWILPRALRERVVECVSGAQVLLPADARLTKYLADGARPGVSYSRSSGYLFAARPLLREELEALQAIYSGHPFRQSLDLFHERSQGIGRTPEYIVRFHVEDLQDSREPFAASVTLEGQILSVAQHATPEEL